MPDDQKIFEMANPSLFSRQIYYKEDCWSLDNLYWAMGFDKEWKSSEARADLLTSPRPWELS